MGDAEPEILLTEAEAIACSGARIIGVKSSGGRIFYLECLKTYYDRMVIANAGI